MRAVVVGCETLGYESFDNSNIFRAISGMEIEEGSRLEQNLFMEESYVGTANLNPEDTYDYETGKKIAIAKLTAKYNIIAGINRNAISLLKRVCSSGKFNPCGGSFQI